MVRQPKQPIREQADVRQETSALPTTVDLFSCPQEGCVRVFQRFSGLERHQPWKLARCAQKNIACWTLQNRSTHLAFMKEQDLCLRYTFQPRKC